MTRPRKNIKEQIVEVSQDYLGPAAERFIDRQISTHLKKSPGAITSQDLEKLIEWLKLSFALLTQNTAVVEEYAKRLRLIAAGEFEKALGAQWQK